MEISILVYSFLVAIVEHFLKFPHNKQELFAPGVLSEVCGKMFDSVR